MTDNQDFLLIVILFFTMIFLFYVFFTYVAVMFHLIDVGP